MIWIEKGFVVVCWRDFFFIIILSQLTAVDLRGGEALGVPKAVSPPRAPPLRPRETGCCPRCGQSACCGQAVADSRFRRAFAEGEQLVSLPSATEVLHATAKRAQRRGFLGRACGLRNFELAPPKGFLSLQTETKLQLKSTIKTFYKALTSRTIIRIDLYVIIGEVASPRSCGCISHLHIRDGCHCLF